MKKNVRKVLTGLLLIMFVVGLVGTAWSFWGYRTGEQDYSDAESLAVQRPVETEPAQKTEEPEDLAQENEPPPETEDGVLKEIDLEALRGVNEDVLGWIQIPGTEISYPLMQGTDNDYYLEHTWQNKHSVVGSIFMDFRNHGDLSDFNTIIYGHNMRDDSMFGGLHDFKTKEFLEAHPCVNIIDETGLHEYRIFAVYEARVSKPEAFQMSFADEAEKRTFLDKCLRRTAINTGVKPTAEGKVITLTTCSGWGYSTRWVVQAVLQDPS